MTSCTATAVIVTATTITHSGDERWRYYGPFLPHVGSAVASFVQKSERELEDSGRYKHWETGVESVFIADGESDCKIRATR